VQGVATYNELAGDPNYGTGGAGPLALYTQLDKSGHPTYFSIPLVQRVLGSVGDFVMGELVGDKQQRNKGFKGLVLNRLNPTVGASASEFEDLTNREPEGPMGDIGYAPPLERLKAAVGGLGDYVPGPVQAAYNFAQLLLGNDQVSPAKIAGEAIGGTGYTGTTPQQRLQEGHLKARYYRVINDAVKAGDKARAWQLYQQMQGEMQRFRMAPAPAAPNPAAPAAQGDGLNPFAYGGSVK
jgi:hypothetical protein